MQYKIINGAVYYDSDMVLENIDIEINDNEKIAIVGRNGCGKTTLLKAIMGEVEMEEGTGESDFRVIKVGSPEISYLKQMPFENESTPMVEEVKKVFKELIDMEDRMQYLVREMERTTDEKIIAQFSELNERYIKLGGLTYKKEYQTMICRFGFTEEDERKSLSEFSGGQRTKIAFIKMLLTKPDILLLDEPTNHLDIETIRWLEEYLKNYKSTLVIVSHDRMFLDRIVNKVYEIEWGETRCYKGNYSSFEQQKKDNYIKQLKDYEAQQAEIARLNRLIERFRYKATKANAVQSRIKMLEKMDIEIIYSDLLDPKITNSKSKCFSNMLYWKYSKENIGAISYLKDKIDGVVFLSTFPCGLDSLVNELVIRKLDIPYLNLIIDDLDSSVGFETRLESFVEILHQSIR